MRGEHLIARFSKQRDQSQSGVACLGRPEHYFRSIAFALPLPVIDKSKKSFFDVRTTMQSVTLIGVALSPLFLGIVVDCREFQKMNDSKSICGKFQDRISEMCLELGALLLNIGYREGDGKVQTVANLQ